jgi:hypothetical protein
MKLVFSLPLLFFSLSAYCQGDDSILHIKYRMTESASLTFDTLIRVDLRTEIISILDVYTDGRFYLMQPSLEDFKIENRSTSQGHLDNESVLIDVFKNRVCFLSDSNWLTYKPLMLATLKAGEHYYASANDTVRFVTENRYEKAVTPFPYYRMNLDGVINVSAKNFSCVLLSCEKFPRNELSDMIAKSASFKANNNIYHFRW